MPVGIAVVIWGAALVLAAWALTPWLLHIERSCPSRWIRYRVHVFLAGLGGVGLVFLPVTPIERGVLAVVALAASLLVVTDLSEHRLPDVVTLPTTALVVAGWCAACLLGSSWQYLARALLAGTAAAAVLLAWNLLSPTGLGLGDVKLGGLLALVLGWFSWQAVLLAGLIAAALAAVVAAGLLITGHAGRRTQLPVGPWLSVGTAVALTAIA